MYYIATSSSYKNSSLVCNCGKRHRTLRGVSKCPKDGDLVYRVFRGKDAAGYRTMMKGMLTLDQIDELSTYNASAGREARVEYWDVWDSMRADTY